MTVTLQNLIDELEGTVYSYTNDRDKVCSLTNDMLATDLSMQVDGSINIDQGFVEIDLELIATPGSGPTAQVPVYPWGRGQRGTSAALHTSGSRVASNPRFPRSVMKQEINQAITNIYPDLWGVATYEFPFVSAQATYPMPVDMESVIRVQWSVVGPTKFWQPVRHYSFDYNADPAIFPNGRSLSLGEGITPGRNVQVVYRQKFAALNNLTDTLAGINFDETWRDLIKLKAGAVMLSTMDSPRLQTYSVENNARSAGAAIPPGVASQVAKSWMAMYDSRLQQERMLLLQQYPTRSYIRSL